MSQFIEMWTYQSIFFFLSYEADCKVTYLTLGTLESCDLAYKMSPGVKGLQIPGFSIPNIIYTQF